ncbi:SGNH/GDSL hydrolase family protein [Agromyces albus]|uniref:SGNH/GDSL hydrolase family protein n=1 Tax=Agromyces albus TaxID=205332 RepID=UPI0027881F64|nr:SGNH/GDSL hydrolase family protein [Agromyces albus]MDQ0574522.1 lysophospholipase L1-like esterase [Agromyces albus]
MRQPRRPASAALWSAAALACLALTGCAIAAPDPDQPVPPSDGATIAAFYGDSYTRGTGASSPERRWSTIVCAERGWYEFNPSVDGLGYVNNRGLAPGGDLVDQIVDHEPSPDVVIVTMGLNDAFSMPSAGDEIREAITDDLERFRTELPDARLVVVEPFWYQDDRPDEFGQIVEWVEDAASRVDADYISGASHWLEGHPEWMSSDVIHPNDDGYAELARRMDAELERLGL